MKIVVMGQGYVGLPLAMAAADAGHRVTGFEPDRYRLNELRNNRSYVEDVPDGLLARHTSSGTYFPTAHAEALNDFDVAVITVPTPLKERRPDLSFVRQATMLLGPRVREGSLIVLESTTHPGTTRDVVVPLLEDLSSLKAGENFHVAFSPERIDPGNPTWSFSNTPKIVGGLTMACRQLASVFYSTITQEVVTADTLEEAELAKVFENTFRHINIALVNELQRLAHELGIDVWNVIELASSKPFGFMKFLPGPGVGGHCLPVDPVYLTEELNRRGLTFGFAEMALRINEEQPAYVVRRLQDALNNKGKALNGSRILALGQSYKPNTADMRESPATVVTDLLREKGARVTAVDPHFTDLKDGQDTEIPFATHYNGKPDDSIDSIADYDAVVLLTPHDAFNLTKVADEATYVLDTRGVMPTRAHIERL